MAEPQRTVGERFHQKGVEMVKGVLEVPFSTVARTPDQVGNQAAFAAVAMLIDLATNSRAKKGGPIATFHGWLACEVSVASRMHSQEGRLPWARFR